MRKSHIAILIIIALAITYIISTSSNYSTYENFTTAISKEGKEFQVVGNLSRPDAMYYKPEEDPNFFSFYMKDKQGKEAKVVYKGPQPADFARSEDIVLTGKMNGDVFEASKILLKCPSKYNDGKLETQTFEAKS
ncbi:MAG: cytochrome c maturation protein CcmE [Chitinophagales bacterium]|nr:cytochrome c maturation protein CcmE [Bacteroidota bacterium]MCB9042241.1 cytochrome c maturation protein CcmE [Chitinophagales bacterium]